MAIAAALIGARGTTTTATVTTTGGTSTGGANSVFYLVVSYDPGVTVSTVADSKSNTYSLVGSVVTGRGRLARYRCIGGTGGASHTATITFSGASFAVLSLVEVTGADVSPVDISTSAVDTTSPYTIASGTLAQAAEVVLAAIESNTGINGAYSESTGFTILSQESDIGNFWTHAVAAKVVASTSSVTASFTRSGDDDAFDAALVLDTFKEAAAGATPTISSTSSATPAYTGSLTITGTNFEASQGTGSVTIGGVTQTVTSWSDTSITVTVARGTNKYGVAVNVVVTNNSALSSSPYALTSLQPQSGWAFVDIGTPDTTIANRIIATPDIASGDQVAYDTVSSTVTVFSDGTFSVSGATTSFDAEVWTSPDGWGATATQFLSTYNLTGTGVRRRQTFASTPFASTGPLGAPAGGGPITGSISETLSATDTVTASAVFASAVAETAAAVDTITASAITAAAVAETGSASDSVSATVTFNAVVAETLAAVDTPSALLVLIAQVNETLAALDTQTASALFNAAVQETLAAADTVTASAVFNASITETLAAVDTTDATITGAGGTTYNDSVSETLSAVDSVSASANFSGAIAETLSAADSIDALLTQLGAIVETLAATETVTGLTAATALVSETGAAADTITALLLSTASVQEVLSAVDTITSQGIFTASIVESMNATDSTDATGGSTPTTSGHAYWLLLKRRTRR